MNPSNNKFLSVRPTLKTIGGGRGRDLSQQAYPFKHKDTRVEIVCLASLTQMNTNSKQSQSNNKTGPESIYCLVAI